MPGYPQPLYHYGKGVPPHGIDTAIWWEPNGHTYFFSGDRYWRYNEETRTTDRDFPKPISRWGRIPPSPKGAFLSDDG
ncbi:matrix metalloproteinase-15-like, partial [Neolamprologus brichardi]